MNHFDLVLNDPNVSLDFQRVLTRQAAKQAPRRFTGEPLTGFDLPDWAIERKREIMAEEHADYLADMQRERAERGE